jgi:uracil-DNA glycosylase
MSEVSGRNAAFLAEMGLAPLWQRRASALVTQEPIAQVEQAVASGGISSAWTTDAVMPPISKVTAMPGRAIAEMNWTELKSAVAGCTQCGLCHGRTQTVFGAGDERAKWLFIGEGPGDDEDKQGMPFVGPAGKLLDNMLLAIGLRRGDNVYLTTSVKCRPSDADGRDRRPSAVEGIACLPYLQRQIALIQPTVIVALGQTAAMSLLQRDATAPPSALRGTVHRYAEVPVIVTYDPAHLLRNPADKRKAWADLCLAVTTYASR